MTVRAIVTILFIIAMIIINNDIIIIIMLKMKYSFNVKNTVLTLKIKF